ncbi:hypothetical protein L1887_10364 [Cichorium endivia]|nr:hypothetical protein L1887_10364 [Cichorium endivia]
MNGHQWRSTGKKSEQMNGNKSNVGKGLIHRGKDNTRSQHTSSPIFRRIYETNDLENLPVNWSFGGCIYCKELKKDSMGNNFGLLRFKNVSTNKTMEIDLNTVKIGNAKISANVAKYDKNKHEHLDQRNHRDLKVPTQRGIDSLRSPPTVWGNTTFRYVVIGAPIAAT